MDVEKDWLGYMSRNGRAPHPVQIPRGLGAASLRPSFRHRFTVPAFTGFQLLSQAAPLWVQGTNSISLGRHSFVKNGSSGL